MKITSNKICAPNILIRSCQGRYSFLIITAILAFICSFEAVNAEDEHARVVVIVANHMSLNDLHAGENLASLARDGAVGLMNTGTRRNAAEDVRFLTLGLGVRPASPADTVMCCESDELLYGKEAGSIYRAQTDIQPPQGSVVCLGFARVLRANELIGSKLMKITPIGESFRSAGLSTSVIGCSDTQEKKVRNSAMIAVDRRGIIDASALGERVLRIEWDAPLGIIDNMPAICEIASKYMSEHSLVVVEIGDFDRLAAARQLMSDEQYRRVRSMELEELDNFIGRIRTEIERSGGTLIFCSPSREYSSGISRSNLTPMIVYKQGIESGMLISDTTRTNGLISNVDVAPTILQSAGLAIPRSIQGQAAAIEPSKDVMKYLEHLERKASRDHAIRWSVFGIIAFLALLTSTITEFHLRKILNGQLLRKILKLFLLGFISLPAAFLIAGAVGTTGVADFVSALLLSAGVLTAVSYGTARVFARGIADRHLLSIAVIHAVTSIILVYDLLTGCRLICWSMPGCDQIAGIRYYGLGNEYMGVMICSSLLGTLSVVRLHRDAKTGHSDGLHVKQSRLELVLVLVWFILAAWVIGFPSLGANVGGLITAVAAFGTAFVCMFEGKPRWVHLAAILCVAGAAVAVFAFMDVRNVGQSGSHLGRSVSMIGVYGPTYLWELIHRKIAMHMGIILTKQAYYPLMAGIPFFVLYMKRMESERRYAEQGNPLHPAAVPAILVGILAAFLLNDSGIVPAGLIMSIYLISMLYLRLGGGS